MKHIASGLICVLAWVAVTILLVVKIDTQSLSILQWLALGTAGAVLVVAMLYGVRGPYLAWYWSRPIDLVCSICGESYQRRRNTCPPNMEDWAVRQCGDCAYLDCLRDGICPYCTEKIPETPKAGGVCEMHICKKARPGGNPLITWGDVVQARALPKRTKEAL